MRLVHDNETLLEHAGIESEMDIDDSVCRRQKTSSRLAGWRYVIDAD